MRTKYVETYRLREGLWMATLTDHVRPIHAPGETEVEALALLCDRIFEAKVESEGYPEEWG